MQLQDEAFCGERIGSKVVLVNVPKKIWGTWAKWNPELSNWALKQSQQQPYLGACKKTLITSLRAMLTITCKFDTRLFGIVFNILCGLASGILSGIAFGFFFSVAFGILSRIIFGFRFCVAFGILSGVAFGILFGIAFGILSGIVLAFYLAYLLALYLASLLAFCLAEFLAFFQA